MSTLSRKKPVYRSSQTWRGLIQAQKRSGQGISQFCLERGITKSCFWKWRRRLSLCVSPLSSQAVQEFADKKPAFLPLPIHSQAPATVVLETNGIRVMMSGDAAREVTHVLVGRLGRSA